MADVVQGNVQAAYQAYFDNMNPAPFAQIVRTPPRRTPLPGPRSRSSHSRRARAQVSAVGILLSLACGEWIALVAFVVALGGAATQQVLPSAPPPPFPTPPCCILPTTARWTVDGVRSGPGFAGRGGAVRADGHHCMSVTPPHA